MDTTAEGDGDKKNKLVREEEKDGVDLLLAAIENAGKDPAKVSEATKLTKKHINKRNFLLGTAKLLNANLVKKRGL